MNRLAIAAAALAGATSTAHADCPQRATGTLQEIVQNYVTIMQVGRAYGLCAVALDSKGHEGFACAGKASDTQSLTKDTLFQIGSLTKPFTATLLARRVHEGTLHLGDRLDPLLPLPFQRGAEDPITLVQLATHHSGLPRDPSSWSGPVMDMLYLDQCLDQGIFCLAPWNPYIYSNFAFQILGYTISNADGYLFDYITDLRYNVLDMLGMTDTMTYEAWKDERPTYFHNHAAHSHDDSFNDLGNDPDPHCPTADPSGCLYSSPHDMRIWLQYWMGLMQPIQPLAAARHKMLDWHDYGGGNWAPLAWDTAGGNSCEKIAGTTTVYNMYTKGGSVTGQRAFIAFLQDPRDPYGVSPLGVVMFANSETIGPWGVGTLAEQLLEMLPLP